MQDDHETLVLEAAVRSGLLLQDAAYETIDFIAAYAVHGGVSPAHHDNSQIHQQDAAAPRAAAAAQEKAQSQSPADSAREKLARRLLRKRQRLQRQEAPSAPAAAVVTPHTDANEPLQQDVPAADTAAFAARLTLPADAAAIEVHFTLVGGQCRACLTIDAATWRIRSLQRVGPGAQERWEYANWRLWRGHCWHPATMHHYVAGQLTESVHVTGCSGVQRKDSSVFKRPPRPMWPPGALH